MELNNTNKEIISQFINHCIEQLGIKKDVNITLVLKNEPGNVSAGGYIPGNNQIRVCVKNRAIADCLRTIAHEMTHQQQYESGVVFPSDDEGLQPYEDEANMAAGKLVRFWGRKHKEIYSDLA